RTSRIANATLSGSFSLGSHLGSMRITWKNSAKILNKGYCKHALFRRKGFKVETTQYMMFQLSFSPLFSEVLSDI
ncbi:hypothetical protein, partial [Palaeococcus sp. (in: euryarchaeotes)]